VDGVDSGHDGCPQSDLRGLHRSGGIERQGISLARTPHRHPDLSYPGKLGLTNPGQRVYSIPGMYVEPHTVTYRQLRTAAAVIPGSHFPHIA